MVKTEDYDILVIGGGLAGSVSAVTAAQKGCRVAIVSKEPIGYGNTRVSGGLIACAGISKGDNAKAFAKDLVAGGEFLNDPTLVEVFAERSREVVSLLKGIGHLFYTDDTGGLGHCVIRQLGGHSHPRTIMTPGEGNFLAQTLRGAVIKAGLAIYENTFVTDILKREERAVGALCYKVMDGSPLVLRARSVVLATGGCGWIFYPNTTCFSTATGDGYALALNAGAELIDMEQVQFIPFGMTHPKCYQGLFCGEPETVGPSGRLLGKDGEVIAEGINRVTRATLAKMVALNVRAGKGSRFGGLKLDLSQNLNEPNGQAIYDKIMKGGSYDMIKKAYGTKAFLWQKPWDVYPSAHFMIGGVKVDEVGQTKVEGLFAAGEVTGGIHGGNRLGSIALAEAAIFGQIVGSHCLRQPKRGFSQIEDEANRAIKGWPQPGNPGRYRPVELKNRLQRVMGSKAGVIRDGEGLRQAMKEISVVEQQINALKISKISCFNLEMVDAFELRLMVQTTKAIVLSALERKESRGAHGRSDYPERDDEGWLRNIVVRKEEGQFLVSLGELQEA